jgi:hypothetical protein
VADAKVTPRHHLETLQSAARSRGVECIVIGVNGPEEIISSIDSAKASGAEALNFLATPLFSVPGTHNNRLSWTVLRRHACQRFSSGPTRRKPVP